jgi:uncharacterized damage-inducible protein DinB
MKRIGIAAAIIGACIGLTGLAPAQEVKGLRGDLIGGIEYTQSKVIQLENAMPDAKFSWRPGADVRSVGEVFAHIAYANYLFGKFAGLALPEGISINSADDGAAFEKKVTDKAAISEALVKSFDYIKAGIKSIPDANLDNQVMFFGHPMSLRNLLLIHSTHLHEHFGQAIAYARTNGVVPPWSMKQPAAESKK